jgi:hypothetical protein
MESPNEMFSDLKEVASVLGINVAAIAISLSEVEQAVRIISGVLAIIYTTAKLYKTLWK